MKKLNSILFLMIISIFIALPVMAADKNIKGSIGAGAYIQGDNDKLDRAGEYKEDDSSPAFNVDIDTFNDLSNFQMKGNYEGEHSHDLMLKGNFQRHLDLNFDYSKLFHRKDHNKLFLDEYDYNNNGQVLAVNPFFPDPGATAKDVNPAAPNPTAPGTKPVGAQKLIFEDSNVGKDYYIKRSETKAKVSFAIPNMENLKLNFKGRVEKRDGYEQITPMVGKCTACHVRGLTKPIDEETRDYVAGFSYTTGPLFFSYNYMHRSFNVYKNTVTTNFDKVSAANPYYGTDHGEIFRPRLNYDSFNGENMEVSKTPESKKNMNTLKLKLDLPYYTTFAAVYTDSSIENKDTDLDIDQNVFGTRLTTNLLNRKLTVAAKFRYLNIDSDDAKINLPTINEEINYLNGQGDALVYKDPAYPGNLDFDWVRKSAIDRDQYTFGIDAVYRMLKNKLKLRIGYEYDQIDRDNFDVYFNKDKTETNKFKAGIDFKPFKTFSGKFKFKYTDVDHPFANKGSACIETTAMNNLVYAGKNVGAYPLIFVHDGQPGANLQLRTLDGTSSPETTYDYALDLNFNPSEKISVSFNGQYVDSNNNYQGSDWDQDQYMLGAYTTFMLSEKFTFSLGYNYAKTNTKSVLSVDLFGG
jgi:opacity protein-like surface antigen